MNWLSNIVALFQVGGKGARPRRGATARQRSCPLRIEPLESRQLLAGYHLDFGSAQSPVASGYTSAPVGEYSAAVGQGWLDQRGVREVVRGSGTSLSRDFLADKDRTFQLDLPNGTYLVAPTLGDATMVRDQMDLYLNGKLVASNLKVEAGRPYQPTYRVDVTNGKLSMRLVDHGGVTVRWALSALDVVSTTSANPVVALNPDRIAAEGTDVALQGTVSGAAGLTYLWDFGDGKTATGTLATKHKYADNGTYSVTLTAKDAQGRTGVAVSTVIVKNAAPRASIKGVLDSDAREGAMVTLTKSVSDSGTTDVAAGFDANWTVSKNGQLFASTSGKSGRFTFTPDDDGTYVVKLTVIDKDGGKSVTASATIIAADTPLRANHLGPYVGVVGKPVSFAGIARDNGVLDAQAGYSYSWKFGDGSSGTGATPRHLYAKAGTYTVTLTVIGKNGQPISTKTTAKIATTGAASPLNDFQIVSTNLLSNTVYGNLRWKELASSGAWGVNAKWEQGTSSKWHIEQQRYGEGLIIDGLLHNDSAAIAAGFKAFDWGFKQQASDGSFAGTEDPFHSTSFFVAAVARSCLLIQQSPYASQYQAKVDSYASKVHKAAKWMATPEVWSRGISNNSPYTHRRYLVATALGLTSQLAGGDAKLMSLARSQILDGLSRQLSNGVNPEAGGYDSSYQAVGIEYAQIWTTYFPKDSTTSAVKTMIDKGLAWESTRILASGIVKTDGNTRTGIETGPSNTIKTVDWRSVVAACARYYQTTGDAHWQAAAQKVAQNCFKTY